MGNANKISVDERLKGVIAPAFFYDRSLSITKPKMPRTTDPSRPSAEAQNIWLAMRSFGGDSCDEDQFTIAAAAGKSDRHVRTYLPELIEQGWVVEDGRVPVPMGSKMFPEEMPKRYVVTMPEWAFKKRGDTHPPQENLSAPPRKTLPDPHRKDFPDKRESSLNKTVSESLKGGVGGKPPEPQKPHAHSTSPKPQVPTDLLAALNAARKVETLPALDLVRSDVQILLECHDDCGQDVQRTTRAYHAFLRDRHWRDAGFPMAAFRKQLGQYKAKADSPPAQAQAKAGPCQHPPGKRHKDRVWSAEHNTWGDFTICKACGAVLAEDYGREASDAAQHGLPDQPTATG